MGALKKMIDDFRAVTNKPAPQAEGPSTAVAMFAGRFMEIPESMGAREAAMEGVKAFRDAFFPGLDWDKFKSEVWHEPKQIGAHGAHETAAALFHGNAFVMYPKAGQELEGGEHDFER